MILLGARGAFCARFAQATWHGLCMLFGAACKARAILDELDHIGKLEKFGDKIKDLAYNPNEIKDLRSGLTSGTAAGRLEVSRRLL